MLGFRQGISSSDSLEVFLDFFNTGVALTNTDSDFLFNSNISALKYKIEGGNMVSVGVEEQNERYITMHPSSYLVVEPVTGLTLEMKVKYSTFCTIASQALYEDEEELKRFKLFDMEVSYRRNNIESVNDIAGLRNENYMLDVIALVLASVSMLMVVVFSLLYLRSKRKGGSEDLIDRKSVV